MNEQSLELVVIFKEGQINSVLLFNYFKEKIPRLFNIEFDEIAYSVKTKGNIKREKSLKYKNANLEKYIDDLTNNDGGFELFSYLPDIKFKSRDINISVSYNPYMYLDDSSSVIITINKDFYFGNNNLEGLKYFYLQILDFLIKIQKKITYGFIFSINNKKFPALLVAGIGNYNLSKDEQGELQVWTNKNSESAFKIWRVFWGNLITINHLTPESSMDKIKKIVGEGNFFMVDNTTCFFNLPNSDLLYGNEDKDLKNELLKLLHSLTR